MKTPTQITRQSVLQFIVKETKSAFNLNVIIAVATILPLIAILTLLVPAAIAQSREEPITISGQDSSTPHTVHPATKVKAKDIIDRY